MPRRLARMLVLTCLLGLVLAGSPIALSGSGAPQEKAAQVQKIDAEYHGEDRGPRRIRGF